MSVEVTRKYATTVDTVQDAFGFVMDRLDTVGDAPSISINPYWSYSDTENGVRRFEVTVSGMTEETADG